MVPGAGTRETFASNRNAASLCYIASLHIDPEKIRAALQAGGRTAVIVDGDDSATDVPAAWLPIVRSADPEERRLLALSLWDGEFLERIGDYARLRRTKLVDVRACALGGQGWVLLYLFDADDPGDSMMIGWDPAGFGEGDPLFWDSIPAPARRFLRQTHAGYGFHADWDSAGLLRPRDMTTLAQVWEAPDGIPGWSENYWPDCDPIDSRRMLHVSRSTPAYLLCTSPDVPAGEALVYYDGEINVVDFFAELTKIMLYGAE